MSSIINKFIGSAASVQNELSLAAANFNLDFTLIKIEAPKEFSGLDRSISQVRRHDAEDGSLHRTARKLGALFDGIPPQAKSLLVAYGERVSEICERQNIEPKERERHGIFSRFTGVDAAGLWAAATSGPNAIAVHLLACLIAGIFNSSQSVALWYELIATRKSEILEIVAMEDDPFKVFTLKVAARQDFTREDLAAWDNSARSWMQTANMATADQRKIVLFHSDEAGKPVNMSLNTYDNVINAWKDAMESMDSLIRGIPQRVRTGAVILAISSWHLYPDICILSRGPNVIHQHDTLVRGSGILTIDSERLFDSEMPLEFAGSVTWSLPLAYLRYYGEPVQVKQKLSYGSLRMTMEDFRFVFLGCIISTWTKFSDSVMDYVDLIILLRDALRLPEDLPPSEGPEGSEDHRSNMLRMQKLTSHSSWIGLLLAVAEDIAHSEGVEREMILKLVDHGRRYHRFIHGDSTYPSPLFGLSHIPSLFSLLNSDEHRILYLRQVASDLELSPVSCVIRYYYNKNAYEYATTQPLNYSAAQHRARTGFIRQNDSTSSGCLLRHARWIPMKIKGPPCGCKESCALENKNGPKSSQLGARFRQTFRGKASQTSIRQCPCDKHGGCSLACHGSRVTTHKCLDATRINDRLAYIEQQGESALPAQTVDNPHDPRNGRVQFGIGKGFHDAIARLGKDPDDTFVPLQFWVGDSQRAEILYCGQMTRDGKDTRGSWHGAGAKQPGHYFAGKTIKTVLRVEHFDYKSLTDWFVTNLRVSHPAFVLSLQACTAAIELYSCLPGATVDASIIGRISLAEVKWFANTTQKNNASPLRLSLSRPEAFACIAMFESGRIFIPLYLKDVFAMTYGNSIYVTSSIMADPSENPKDSEIRRVHGNIGQSGLSFLIPPPEPKLRKSTPNSWTVVNHAPFSKETQLENSFWKTSMHLTLTQYQPELPGLNQDEHYIDESTALRETVVQVYDGSEWVCDLDILSSLRNPLVSRLADCQETNHSLATELPSTFPSTVVIDNWEEIFTPPIDTAHFLLRTSGNWLGRLAAVGVATQLRKPVIILPDKPCWICVHARIIVLKKESKELISFVLIT
ncbi:hypothetical protein QQS21_010870 [Conoideocrella luteorostrata]|uniref:Uncharacterized protein n=1 Tax=Conoideocrella luteorostrata TaxID=1105319 RepID=A0AAJ0CEG4_9HYPO|nr:hypothetical protein QQS21_010870 [Conoideocrella luteorostrata]